MNLHIYHPMTWVDYDVCVFAHHFNMTQRPLDLAIESINWHLMAVNVSLKTDHPIKTFNSKTEHIANIMCIWVNHMHALYNLYAPLSDQFSGFLYSQSLCHKKSHQKHHQTNQLRCQDKLLFFSRIFLTHFGQESVSLTIGRFRRCSLMPCGMLIQVKRGSQSEVSIEMIFDSQIWVLQKSPLSKS